MEEVVATVEAEGDSFSSLIINIVKSYPFQHARSSPGEPLPASTSAELFHPVREAQPETEEVTEARGARPALGQVPARAQRATNAGDNDNAAAVATDTDPAVDDNPEEME